MRSLAKTGKRISYMKWKSDIKIAGSLALVISRYFFKPDGMAIVVLVSPGIMVILFPLVSLPFITLL